MLKFLSALLVGVALSLNVHAADTYVAGKHYEVLSTPVATRDKTKVEVVELFWYGCIHCYHFEPVIQAWKKKQDSDVDFQSMPAMWNKDMILHAKAFYTAKALGNFDKMSEVLFNTMNVKKNRLKNEAAIKKVFVDNGVDAQKFDQVFNSFGVRSQVSLADSRARSYRLQGTPEMVVNGKYRISSTMAGGQAQMLKVVDFLVARERKAMSK